MEMKLLTPDELEYVYYRDLQAAFPKEELKPFRAMKTMEENGKYSAWGLMDGEDIAGIATVCRVAPGWALFDYLCVAKHRRNDGLGAQLIQKLVEAEKDCVLFGETEVPEFAPDPAMAQRRFNFYIRNGAKEAGYDMTLFGAPFRILYWADREVPAEEIAAHHQMVYQSRFSPYMYNRYIHIPWKPEDGMPERVNWSAVDSGEEKKENE